jgi:hypothetical protein
VLDAALFSQKVSMPASYHAFAAGNLITIHLPEYRFAHLAPVHNPVKPDAKISLFCSDKKSIIIVKYFEIYEARVGVGVKTSDSEQDWLSPDIQVIISISP